MPYDQAKVDETLQKIRESLKKNQHASNGVRPPASAPSVEPPPPPLIGTAKRVLSPMDIWKFRVAEIVKVDCEKAGNLTYQNTHPDQLIDSATNWALSVIRETGLNPPEESDLEQEVQNIASGVVQGYLERYGVNDVPALREKPQADPNDPFADALPIDVYQAYQAMRAEPREYSHGGLIKWGATAGATGLMASGKTTYMINVVEGWANGTDVIGRTCKQSRTLVVASPKEYDNWVETIGMWGLQEKVWIIESPKVHFGDPHKTASWFDTMMERYQCRTFALDTLFDFYGISANYGGDINRTAMNEQAPLIMCVRARNYSGIVGAHMPKTEARAVDPRDPEEAMAGASGWWAQHRMRIALRRKANGVIAILTGKGGYGDDPIMEEHLLKYDEVTRHVELGGLFSNHLGEAALPSVLETLQALGKWTALSKLMTETGRGEKWIRPGLKEGVTRGVIFVNGKKGRARRWIAKGCQDDDDEPQQGNML